MTFLKVALLFFLTGLLIYANSLSNGFVWDDVAQILENQPIHSIANLSLFFAGGTFGSGGSLAPQGSYYRPFMTTVFSLIYTLAGPNPFYFHLVQVILHILNAILLFYVYKYFFGQTKPLFLSLLFLVHPINVESVVYISALQEPLFMFFGLLSLVILQTKISGIQAGLMISTFLLLSILSKETGFLFILILLLFQLFQKNGKMFNFLYSAGLTICLYLVLRTFRLENFFRNSQTFIASFPINQATLFERISNIPAIIKYYLITYLFPINLSIAQYWLIRDLNLTTLYLPLAIIVGALVGLFFWWKSLKRQNSNYSYVLGFFSIWLILGLSIHLQIIHLDMTVAERWFYFPEIGLIGIIGVFLQTTNLKTTRFKNLTIIMSIIILTLLSIRTFVRNLDWKDEFTLASHDAGIVKDNYYLENMVGIQYIINSDPSQGIIHLEKSTKLYPQDWNNWANLGAAYADQGNLQQATVYYRRSLKNFPFYKTYQNLVSLYYQLNDFISAKEIAQEGLSIYPSNINLLKLLAVSENRLGESEAALSYTKKVQQLNPTQGDQLFKLIQQGQQIELKQLP